MAIPDDLREQLRACSKDEAAFRRLVMLFEQAQTTGSQGGHHGMLFSERDVIEASLEREKLRVALQKARELNDLKTRMMARISHEFRTLLAIILTSSEMLDRYHDRLSPDDRRSRARFIRQQVFRFTEMLNDIALFLRDEPLEPKYVSVNLEQLCRTAIDRINQATGSCHHLRLAAEGEVQNVTADPDLMSIIVTHLLSNAVKYSPAGTTVHLALSGMNNHIRLSVRDEGIGIPPGEQTRVFEPFYRGSNAGETAGVGLGLSLVSRAVAALGGQVALQSAPHKGTTFTVTLKKREAAKKADT